ncbi:MAG: hypothetical protein LBE44_01265 [Microbacterium hominis]|nr:hypothetical protein [Microbacterium hominis]
MNPQKMRGILSSNISHSYLAWYYYLDRDIIDEPEPERPSANFRARREMQSINADLFEARIGALALDGQTSEIETWLSLFILGAKEALEAVAGANEAEMGTSRRNRNRKRKAETGQFCDGREMGQ